MKLSKKGCHSLAFLPFSGFPYTALNEAEATGGGVIRGLVILAIIYRVLLGSFWEWADFQPWLDMGWPLLGSNYPLQGREWY